MLYHLPYIQTFKVSLCIFLLSFLVSCTGKESNAQEKISVSAIDSAEFRTLYEELIHESPENSAADFDYNPLLISELNSNLIRRLQEVGLMKKDRLILTRFKPDEHFDLKDSVGDSLSINMNYIMRPSTYRIAIASKKDTINIDFTEYLPIIKVAVADVIPGGFNELIVLRNLYIMNGDNYYINIYEVRM